VEYHRFAFVRTGGSEALSAVDLAMQQCAVTGTTRSRFLSQPQPDHPTTLHTLAVNFSQRFGNKVFRQGMTRPL